MHTHICIYTDINMRVRIKLGKGTEDVRRNSDEGCMHASFLYRNT